MNALPLIGNHIAQGYTPRLVRANLFMDDGPKENTDRLIWRKSDDAFSPSIHVTASGAIGINCGGTVIVMPIERWHELATDQKAKVHRLLKQTEYNARTTLPREEDLPTVEDVQAIYRQHLPHEPETKSQALDA